MFSIVYHFALAERKNDKQHNQLTTLLRQAKTG
jgi:hypothetical protein